MHKTRKPYDFKFVAFTDITETWSGSISKDCDVPPTRLTELKFAKDQGFCTTLCYVVFTDGKNKIGDAMRIQNTTLMPDA